MMEIKDSNLKELDDPTKDLLRQMAEDEENTYRMAAQSLVNRMDDTFYFGAVYLPEGWQQRRPKTETAPLAIEKQNQLKVYPNPAKDYITIEFEIADMLENAELLIINQQGQLIGNYNLSENQNFFNLSVLSYRSGIYTIILRNNRKDIKTAKISILNQ